MVSLRTEFPFILKIFFVSFVTCRPTSFRSVVPPQIITQLPPTATWNEGEDRRLKCEATGKPKAQVVWMKNGEVVTKEKRTTELAFSPVSYTNHGLYKCVAENIGGRKEKKINITVLCK